MMLSLNDRESHLDAFRFFLAQQLGMTVADLEARMGHQEYLEWVAYFTAKRAMEEVAR
jgi:hypothetical protein